jgi:hypothetical protein
LAYKNKPGFLEELVMKAQPSLTSILTNIKRIAKEKNFATPEMMAKNQEDYIKAQKNSPNVKFEDGIIIQYGGGSMFKPGSYDRYTPFENYPEADFLVIAWPMGLVQASKNPFKKGANPINLGELAMGILNKHKSELQAMPLTMGTVKRMMEMDIKKGSTESVGFTMDDFMALFGEVAMNLPKSPGFQNMVKDIAGKQYKFLSPKQKSILDSVTTTVYDVIVKGSGGHRDITNISGLNFLGKGYTTFLKQLMGELAEALASARLQ